MNRIARRPVVGSAPSASAVSAPPIFGTPPQPRSGSRSGKFLRPLVRTIAVGLVLGSAACGSDGSLPGTSKPEPVVKPSPNVEDQRLAYVNCLRENGLKVSDPKPGEAGSVDAGNAAEVEAALTACADQAPVDEKARSTFTQAEKDEALRYARCMREGGVDMADPKFGEHGVAAQPAPAPGAESERYEQADKKCRTPAR